MDRMLTSEKLSGSDVVQEVNARTFLERVQQECAHQPAVYEYVEETRTRRAYFQLHPPAIRRVAPSPIP